MEKFNIVTFDEEFENTHRDVFYRDGFWWVDAEDFGIIGPYVSGNDAVEKHIEYCLWCDYLPGNSIHSS